MPKVYLTDAQRQEAALQSTYQKIADGLAAFRNRKQLNNGQLGDELGINRKSVAKLLHTEALQVDVITLLKVIRLAGMEVKTRDL